MANKRKNLTPEHKRNISIALSGKPKPWQRGKPSNATGHHHSIETRRKISEAGKGRIPPNKGKKMSLALRMKISETSKGRKAPWHYPKNIFYGVKSWNWKGGISGVDRLIRRMKEYLQWRSDVFQKDNWTCKTCGINGCYVTAHHIKGLSKIVKENNIFTIEDARRCEELWNIDNGITLCEVCHSLTDNYQGRGRERRIS